jgi:hypothetical protein
MLRPGAAQTMRRWQQRGRIIEALQVNMAV